MVSPANPSAGFPIEPERTVPLCQLRVGDRARLHSTSLCGEDCELLRAMGLTDRCELRICRMGEPCIVQVNRTRLGLTRAMTQNIFVALTAAVD